VHGSSANHDPIGQNFMLTITTYNLPARNWMRAALPKSPSALTTKNSPAKNWMWAAQKQMHADHNLIHNLHAKNWTGAALPKSPSALTTKNSPAKCGLLIKKCTLTITSYTTYLQRTGCGLPCRSPHRPSQSVTWLGALCRHTPHSGSTTPSARAHECM
jgi:hypothetical protein